MKYLVDADVLSEVTRRAASALQHHLTIVTRNIADFRNVGVPLMDPFEIQ